MNSTWTVIIGVVVLVAILSVYVGGSSKEIQVGEGAKAGDLSLSLCTVKLNSGKYNADCGTLIVPENRNDPNSRLIALPVTRIHATGANSAEPLFQYEPMNFEVKSGFPLIAKLLVGLIIPVLVLIVWLMVRRLRSSRKSG